MKPFVLGAIFARGGSKRIYRKNLQLLNGIPLIAHSIMHARQVAAIDRLIVSTDDPDIAAVAREFGAEVPFMRPRRLATDRSPEILSWKHAIKTVQSEMQREIDILLAIPVTSPLREPKDVSRCLKKLQNSRVDMVVTMARSSLNPYYNMVTVNRSGIISLVLKPKKIIASGQTAPRVFGLTTAAYAARAQYILKTKSEYDGKVAAIEIPAERALDIDSPLDLEIAEFLIRKRAHCA